MISLVEVGIQQLEDQNGKSEKHLLRKASDHDSADSFYPANNLTIISKFGFQFDVFANLCQHRSFL